MSDKKKLKTYGLVGLNDDTEPELSTHMHQVSVITDRSKPTSYSQLDYFTQSEWDEYPFASQDEMAWWMDSKYGLFLHWGPCSVIGREIGWSRGGTRGAENPGNEVPLEVYDQAYKYFDPQRFDADELVSFAKAAGLRYIILIAKHHDGFCMWNTATTDYNIMNSPYGRDISKELADACAAQDMPFGFYFSQRDWYHPDYFTDNHMRYADYMCDQVRELLTGYGRISILWFDAWYPSLFTPEHWHGLEINRLAKQLQPGIIINNRCSLPGDYDTPEGVVGSYQVNRPWETTTSIHASWSWHPDTFRTVKSFKKCLDILAGCTVGGGNLLFNVGPRPDGAIEPEIRERFMELGRWLDKYGESIYGTRGGPLRAGGWGGYCARGNTLYIHVLYPNALPAEDGCVLIDLPEGDIVSAACLTGETGLRIEGRQLKLNAAQTDPDDTVIRIEYAAELPVFRADPRNGSRLD